MKSNEIKSPQASLPIKGQVAEQTSVENERT